MHLLFQRRQRPVWKSFAGKERGKCKIWVETAVLGFSRDPKPRLGFVKSDRLSGKFRYIGYLKGDLSMSLNGLKYLSILLLTLSLTAFGSNAVEYQEINLPLQNLDLSKFEGKWFEIASTKNDQRPGAYCTTKLIKVLDTAQIFIQNSFRTSLPDHEMYTNEIASVFSSQLPGVWTYRDRQTEEYKLLSIVQVEFNYKSAVAIGKNGTPVIVLSRSPELDLVTLAAIRGRLVLKGYSVSDLKQTLQQGCWPALR